MVIELLKSWSFGFTSMWLIFYWLWSTERCFHCVDVSMFGSKFSPDGNSSSLFFSPVYTESAIVVTIMWLRYLWHQEWEYSWSVWILSTSITVEEYILSSAVVFFALIKFPPIFVVVEETMLFLHAACHAYLGFLWRWATQPKWVSSKGG